MSTNNNAAVNQCYIFKQQIPVDLQTSNLLISYSNCIISKQEPQAQFCAIKFLQNTVLTPILPENYQAVPADLSPALLNQAKPFSVAIF